MGSVVAAVNAVEQALRDINIDEETIQGVVTSLHEATTELGDKSFQRQAKIAPSSFGGNPAAADLGFHHDKAYLVIDDTLRGVVEDLLAFATNVKQAAKLVAETDENVATDMRSREAVAASMNFVWRHSHGDSANHESRNEHLAGSTDGGS